MACGVAPARCVMSVDGATGEVVRAGMCVRIGWEEEAATKDAVAVPAAATANFSFGAARRA